MSKLCNLVMACVLLLAPTTALPNGSSVISAIEYVYLMTGKRPALVVVVSDTEIERLTRKAKELNEAPLSAHVANTPIRMRLRARQDNLGLTGHIDQLGYRVYVVSTSQADSFL